MQLSLSGNMYLLIALAIFLFGIYTQFKNQHLLPPGEELATDQEGNLQQWRRWSLRYPKRTIQTGPNCYFLQDPDLIKQACSQLTTKAPTSDILIPFLGKDSILPANGRVWRQRRSLMNKLLKSSTQRQADIALQTVSEIGVMSVDAIRLYTFNASMRIIVGREWTGDLVACQTYSATLKTALTIIGSRYADPTLQDDAEFRKTEASKQLDSSLSYLHSFIPSHSSDPESLLSQYAMVLDPEATRGEVSSLLTGSVENTYSTILFSLLLLAKHPEVQSRVRANENLIPSVIAESLRLYPVITDMSRIVDRDDFKLGGIRFPRETQLDWAMWSMGEWRAEFDPERAECPFAIPFGLGARDCPGKTMAMIMMRTILAHILRRYQVSTPQPHIEYEVDMLLRPKNPQLLFTALN